MTGRELRRAIRRRERRNRENGGRRDPIAREGGIGCTASPSFTASETFDVGIDTSSPVANDYFDQAPFAFNGELLRLHFAHL